MTSDARPASLPIRQATIDDAAAVAELHRLSRQAAYAHFMPHSYLFGDEFKAEGAIWATWLAGQETETHVCEIDGRIVGFMRFGDGDYPGPGEGYGYVAQLYLAPDVLRRGLGSVLLDLAEQGLRRRGFKAAYLSVYEDNNDARGFYEQRGWSFDGVSWPVERGGAELQQLRYVKSLE